MLKKDFNWNLQLFAEGDPGEGDPGEGAGEENKEEEKKYTDADLDKIISKKFAEIEKKKQKEIEDERAKAKKEIDEAKKLAEMNEAEKQAHETEKLKNELAELKAANARAEMSKVARGIFNENGVTTSDAIVNMLVTDDAESTKAAVESYIEIFNAEVSKAVKGKLAGSAPKKGSPSSDMTREDILKVKNRTERQKLINEHKDLFGI